MITSRKSRYQRLFEEFLLKQENPMRKSESPVCDLLRSFQDTTIVLSDHKSVLEKVEQNNSITQM